MLYFLYSCFFIHIYVIFVFMLYFYVNAFYIHIHTFVAKFKLFIFMIHFDYSWFGYSYSFLLFCNAWLGLINMQAIILIFMVYLIQMNDLFYCAWFSYSYSWLFMLCMVLFIHIHGLLSWHERIWNLVAPFHIHIQLAKKHSMF